MNRSFECDDLSWKTFISKVGHGNASKVIRNFVKSFGTEREKKSDKKYYLEKKKALLEPKYMKLHDDLTKIKIKLAAIEEKERLEELKRMEKEKKQKETILDMELEQTKKAIGRPNKYKSPYKK